MKLFRAAFGACCVGVAVAGGVPQGPDLSDAAMAALAQAPPEAIIAAAPTALAVAEKLALPRRDPAPAIKPVRRERR